MNSYFIIKMSNLFTYIKKTFPKMSGNEKSYKACLVGLLFCMEELPSDAILDQLPLKVLLIK